VPRSLRIAVAQPVTSPHNVAGNALAHAVAVRATDARVVVFPELSLTGYEPTAVAVDPADERLGPLIEACATRHAVALVGAPVRGPDGHGRSIGVLAVTGDGAGIAYRKVHLGAAELTAGWVAGAAPAAFEVDGWRLGLAVCRDTGVEEHGEATAALGVDAYVAGVVHAATERTLHAERARRVAAAHGIWAVTASFSGPTGGGFDVTAGRSGIWSPDGTCLVEAGDGAGEVVAATLGDD